jgi:hypothetical protein
MGEIRVIPDELRHAGTQTRQIGGRVADMAGDAGAIKGGEGSAPPATASALPGLHARWSTGIAGIGDALSGLGMSNEVAAGLYEETDANVVPRS